MVVAKQISMGIGEAIKRLIHIEIMRGRGMVSIPKEALAERDLIVEALNSYSLDLGFDCDTDDVPNSVAVFSKSAKTSCCRLDKGTRSSNRRN